MLMDQDHAVGSRRRAIDRILATGMVSNNTCRLVSRKCTGCQKGTVECSDKYETGVQCELGHKVFDCAAQLVIDVLRQLLGKASSHDGISDISDAGWRLGVNCRGSVVDISPSHL